MNFVNNMAERQGVLYKNLIGWEPRCMACARTDLDIRMSASGAVTPSLEPCPKCKMTFYCSGDHWKSVKHIHEEACEDGHDGLSQCEINQEIRDDIRFADIVAPEAPFRWAPTRTKPVYASLEEADWIREYGRCIMEECQLQMPAAAQFVRSASNGLTMPMTILWALEGLNEDDAWTRKETLVVHILGAYDHEVMNAMVFEEILHHLPEVKTLKLVLCGPQLGGIVPLPQRNRAIDMETCPDCRRHGRKRIHYHYVLPYHDLVKMLGDKFVPPDLAIAFNSGSSQDAVASWQETIGLLVQRNIPTVFTAYNREEAENEAKILTGAGAKLVTSLGPKKNPWGSILTKKEPNKVIGYYAVNGWLAGGFK